LNKSIQEKAFFKVLEDLRNYLPYLVVVGGWVPYLYRDFHPFSRELYLS